MIESEMHIESTQRKPLSLCIPTNGVIEWVFPVLDSIYEQGIDNSQFEVVVTDNGQNEEFKELMREFAGQHDNLVYLETSAPLFLNMIECFKAAQGEFIKFVNHRMLLREGSLKVYLQFIEANRATHPVIYFSNASIEDIDDLEQFNDFDGFAKGLSYWSSWSAGMGFWRDEFEKTLETSESFNETFPQTTILFNDHESTNYIIDNRKLMEEIPVSHEKKGKYDLFQAFAVEYLSLVLDLVRGGKITIATFLKIKNDTRHFLAGLYFDFVLRKKPCSYDLSSYDEAIKVFYSKGEMRRAILKRSFTKIKSKVSCVFLR